MSDIFATEKPRQGMCIAHGEFLSRHVFGKVWTPCPACSAEIAEKDRASAEQKDREQKSELWRRRIGGAGIPDRFMDRSLRCYKAETEGQKRALAFAEAYANTFDEVLKTGRSAVFIGKPGTGKTHLAVGIGLRIMHRDGRSVLFSTVMRAIRRIRNTWGRNAEESETDAIGALTSVDLLILDEVGIQCGTENEKLLIFDVLNERYERRLPTILLSNLGLEDVKQFLGERVYDRLCEDGGEVVVFDWESHRGKLAA
jgi:DNA replication protein DnaC